MVKTIDFVLEADDIKEVKSDVIALKYAKDYYGAASDVAVALDREENMHIPPDSYELIPSNSRIHAKFALFVGVPPLSEFNYSGVRHFSAKVLEILSSIQPNVGHVAMTIQGPGYGLDDIESAFSQFAGILDAIKAEKFPSGLKRITIVDWNLDRIRRLRSAFDQHLSDSEYASRLDGQLGYALYVQLISTDTSSKSYQEIETAGVKSESKPNAFVAMPFRKEMEDVFYFGIQEPARRAGFLCERIDEESFTGDVLDQVKRKIETCTVVIADLTESNPNVYLEVGYAWGKNRPTILLAKQGQEIKFDVKGQRYLKYETIKGLQESLIKELNGLKSKDLL